MKFEALKKLYAKAVIDGDRTIDTVPEVLRADVQTLINAEPKPKEE
jgi:hypothetical protein